MYSQLDVYFSLAKYCCLVLHAMTWQLVSLKGKLTGNFLHLFFFSLVETHPFLILSPMPPLRGQPMAQCHP
jgi:hypothetical protein